MFSAIKDKIILGLGVAFGFILMLLKIKNNKIENLEDENEAMGEVIDISDKMQSKEKQLKKEAEDEKDNIDGSDWRDNI